MESNQGLVDVYFSLGSNLGNRMAYLKSGLQELDKLGTCVSVSSVVETPAWGYDDPHPYLNLVAHYQMQNAAEELRLAIKEIESKAGRASKQHPKQRYEARTLDIDILFYGDEVIESPNLQIPHPRLHLRNFVLLPLAEISPNLHHPVLKQSVAQLMEVSPDQSPITQVADGV